MQAKTVHHQKAGKNAQVPRMTSVHTNSNKPDKFNRWTEFGNGKSKAFDDCGEHSDAIIDQINLSHDHDQGI